MLLSNIKTIEYEYYDEFFFYTKAITIPYKYEKGYMAFIAFIDINKPRKELGEVIFGSENLISVKKLIIIGFSIYVEEDKYSLSYKI